MKTKINLFSLLIIFWSTLFTSLVVAAEKSGGGGGKSSASAGVEASYHPNAQVWVGGQKDEATYKFSGSSWLAYLTSIDATKSGKNIAPPTIAVWGGTLTNAYTTNDPSGSQAKEVMKTQGIGLGVITRSREIPVCLALLLGAERAFIDQSGDSPRSQRYPYGAHARAGLGYALMMGSVGIDFRGDYTFKHFPSTKWNGDSLKTMQVQTFAPTIGISVNM